MKHIYKLLALTLLLTACGGDKNQTIDDILATGDVKLIQTKKDQLVAQQQELVTKIKNLDEFPKLPD